MIRYLILPFVVVFLVGCAKSTENKVSYFSKNFIGLWAETEWNYHFYQDGRFELKCKGHYAFNTYPGTYFIHDSIIYLTPYSDWQILDGVMQTRLKVVGDNCLRDNNNNFYCTSIDDLNVHLEDEYQWQKKIISVLDSLPIIAAKKDVIPIHGDYDKVQIRYNGVIVVKQIELHHFSLARHSTDNPQKYLDFLVRRNPLNIYLHHSVKDSLSLIYGDRRN